MFIWPFLTWWAWLYHVMRIKQKQGQVGSLIPALSQFQEDRLWKRVWSPLVPEEHHWCFNNQYRNQHLRPSCALVVVCVALFWEVREQKRPIVWISMQWHFLEQCSADTCLIWRIFLTFRSLYQSAILWEGGKVDSGFLIVIIIAIKMKQP